MLKAEPLTVEEVNRYSVGHVNKYTYSSKGTAYNFEGFGAIAYYTSETCGLVNGLYTDSGCINNYNESDIKYVVDGWVNDKFSLDDLVEDETGYSARLLTIEELRNNLGYGESNIPTEQTPDWLFHFSYFYYWTMSPCSDHDVWTISSSHGELYCWGTQGFDPASGGHYVVRYARPVVTLKKTAIEKEETIDDIIDNKDERIIDDKENKETVKDSIDKEEIQTQKNDNKIIQTKVNVKVPNTFQKVSIIFILIGVVLVSVSTIIIIRKRNKFNK